MFWVNLFMLVVQPPFLVLRHLWFWGHGMILGEGPAYFEKVIPEGWRPEDLWKKSLVHLGAQVLDPSVFFDLFWWLEAGWCSNHQGSDRVL